MKAPIEPVNLSHCVLSPILPSGFDPTRSFAHPVTAYSVTAKQTGTIWQVQRITGGNFPKWAIKGQGQTFTSPQEAARAINSLLMT